MFSKYSLDSNFFNKMGNYKNGNYQVVLFNDGTKIRVASGNETKLIPSRLECIDLKITDYCDMDCPMCYECSSKKGKHAEFHKLRNLIESLDDYTEVAVGGGNPLAYPNLDELFNVCDSRRILLNMTVNARHFMQEKNLKQFRIWLYYGDINGLGVSLPSDYSAEETKELCREIKGRSEYSSIVIHVINGLVTLKQLRILEKYKMKVLILGYKDKGRGKQLREKQDIEISERQRELHDELERLIARSKVVSFDNLAIKQLNIEKFCSEHGIEFNRLYMGDDGEFTLYVNLVDDTFAISSTEINKYNINDYTDNYDIHKLFDKVREEKLSRHE